MPVQGHSSGQVDFGVEFGGEVVMVEPSATACHAEWSVAVHTE